MCRSHRNGSGPWILDVGSGNHLDCSASIGYGWVTDGGYGCIGEGGAKQNAVDEFGHGLTGAEARGGMREKAEGGG